MKNAGFAVFLLDVHRQFDCNCVPNVVVYKENGKGTKEKEP